MELSEEEENLIKVWRKFKQKVGRDAELTLFPDGSVQIYNWMKKEPILICSLQDKNGYFNLKDLDK